MQKIKFPFILVGNFRLADVRRWSITTYLDGENELLATKKLYKEDEILPIANVMLHSGFL
jgi:hypothetical protein